MGDINFFCDPAECLKEHVGVIWNDPLGPYIPIVRREFWLAEAPKFSEPLVAPIKYIRFCHTQTEMSFYPDCLEEVKEMQKDHMKKGMPDIAYNFLIGGDGTLYEGRGWAVEADRPSQFASLKGKCLDVAYIGDLTEQPLPWLMANLAVNLIKYGVKARLIDQSYEVIQYNETTFKLLE